MLNGDLKHRLLFLELEQGRNKREGFGSGGKEVIEIMFYFILFDFISKLDIYIGL